MMKRKRAGRIRTWVIAGLLLVAFGAGTRLIAGAPAAPVSTASTASRPNHDAAAIRYYGIVYPYLPGLWTEGDRAAIQQQLDALHTLGVDTIVQVFASRPASAELEDGWLIFLDEAQQAGIQVIARVYPADERAWYGFRMKTIRRFLKVTAQHPAMLAYLGLHEPFEQYTSRQLQRFYRAMKAIAPDLPVAHLLGDMAAFDRSVRFPNRQFAPDICDLCVISYYPAQVEDGQAVFDHDALQALLADNRQLAAARDPDAQIWFLGQTFAQASPGRSFRMPSPAEMRSIFTLAQAEGVDGFLWYPWIHDAYDQVLGDASSQAQQEAVRQIAENRATPQPAREIR